MKKKISLIITVGALLVCLCACGGRDVQNQAAPASTAASQDAAVSQTKTGIVIEASMHGVIIEAPDGSTYTFNVDDGTEIIGDGENLGDTVSVEFEGDYSDGVSAKRIRIDKKADENISASAAEVTQKPQSNSEASGSKENRSSHVKYITGIVKDASMNNITVEWNGSDYTILKDDNTTVSGSVEVGDTVRVYHTGDLADGVVAVDISVVDAGFADKNVKYITGKVADASMNSVIIEVDGRQYSVLKDDNTKSDSIQVGDTVRVYHKGSFADGMTATAIIKQ